MFVDIPATRSILTANGVREYKMVVVGPRKVGKSASVVRFLTKRFISEYVENTDMSCKRVTEVDGEPLRVNIQDTSDKGMRLSSLEHHIRWADAIMMVYSITDREGFRQLKKTATRIIEKTIDLEEKDHRRIPPLVVVGNKGDLDYVRKVSREEGFELAEQLRCDFFEASAREGWSKLVTRTDLFPGSCSPSSDSEVLSLFAGATATVGMVGLSHPGVSGCTTPPQKRGRSPTREFMNLRSSESLKRWASSNAVNSEHRHKRSNSTVSAGIYFTAPQANTAANNQIFKSVSSSPALSGDDSDNSRSVSPSPSSKSRKSANHGNFIGRLSPRLGRKFSRVSKLGEHQTDSNFRDGNNNNKQKKLSANSIAFGLSSTFLANPYLGGTPGSLPKSLSSSSNSSCGNSSTGSSNSSTSGSTESLTLCEQDFNDNESKTFIETRRDHCISHNSIATPPKIEEPPLEFKLQEQEFGSSEPFLHLCRGRLHRGRGRSRSPSHKIMNGLKKIRSFAIEHNTQTNQNLPQVNTALLSIPVIKL